MGAQHHTAEYRACLAELRSRGRHQPCMTCGRMLDATQRRGHPQHMTLGHRIPVDTAPELAYVPSNYGPECEPCNAAGGAAITNRKRRGGHAGLRTSPDWK